MPDIAPPSAPVVELTTAEPTEVEPTTPDSTFADPTDAGPATDRFEAGRSDQVLLVITSARTNAGPAAKAAATAGLMLPFARARVVPIGGMPDLDSLAVEAANGYDTVVIDGPSLGPAMRAAAVVTAGACLRSRGRIIVVMEPVVALSDGPGAAAYPVSGATEPSTTAPATGSTAAMDNELTWLGVASLDGAPCAVLGRRVDQTDPRHATSSDVAGRLATMAQALAAAGSRAYDQDGGELGGSPIGRGMSDQRYESEAALLAHLRTVVQEQAVERTRREQAEQRCDDLEQRYRNLERQHARLRNSKVGLVMTRYWQLRKRLRRVLGG